MRGNKDMGRLTRGFWITMAAAALALSACSTSKANTGHPATTGGSTQATTPATGAGTTLCTIPQNNGGDHDADNNGGPSDGDGCDV